MEFFQAQQTNINYLEQQIESLEKEIGQPPTTKTDKLELKDKLTLKKDRVNAQNALYGTLAQSIGGLLFFVTIYFTWRNVKATEDKQIAERFSKAIEQLQSEKLGVQLVGVQLGGIYALEQIAKDSKKYYWTIMEVLTAFVRESSVDSQGSVIFSVQEAVKVIGRLNSHQERKGKTLDLRGAKLIKGNLAEVNFEGIDLRGANFSSSNLGGATFDGADLRKANFSNVNSSVEETVKKVSFINAKLIKANFSNARLSRSIFNNANMNDSDLSQANLSYGQFINAKLISANLTGANLSKANFSNANLSGAILEGSDLNEADLTLTEGLNPQK